MDANLRESIIHAYIEGYNDFDIQKMIAHLDDDIVFQNINDGEMNMSLQGIEAFKAQAEQAKAYFSERKQTVKAFYHQPDETTVEIEYKATLAIDLPNGPKKGTVLQMPGRSIFTFWGERIIRLIDKS